MHDHDVDVTVIVTCYNHQAFVEQCLASLAAETRKPRQVIIIDDASTDDSVAVIRAWLDRYGFDATVVARSENGGVCAAMNDALALAESPFLRHISADDWFAKDQLPAHVEALRSAGESIAFAVGNIHETDGGGLLLASHDVLTRCPAGFGVSGRERLHLALLEANVIPAPGVVMRTAAVRAVGGYDPSLVFEDWDMWLRLTARFAAVHHPAIVASYRVLESSLTRAGGRTSRFLDSELRALQKHLGCSDAGDEVIRRRSAQLRSDIDDAELLAQSESKSRGTRRRTSVTRSL